MTLPESLKTWSLLEHNCYLHHFKSLDSVLFLNPLCRLTESLQVLRTYLNTSSNTEKCHSARTLAFLMAALHRRNQFLRLPCLQEVSLPYLTVSDEIC